MKKLAASDRLHSVCLGRIARTLNNVRVSIVVFLMRYKPVASVGVTCVQHPNELLG